MAFIDKFRKLFTGSVAQYDLSGDGQLQDREIFLAILSELKILNGKIDIEDQKIPGDVRRKIR